MKSEDRVAVIKCGECGKVFKYESEKRRHEQSHAPQFQCKVCSKKFSFLSALRRHEKQHERKGSVCCDECGGKFRDETLLKRHMQYAHKGTFSCSECKATFSSQTALRIHSKTHKPEAEREYRCSFEGCGKTFNFPHHLKHHELTHTDVKQHFCKECGKGFIQSYHLKVHQRVHEPESWLSCTVFNCTKSFTNEYALKRHLATHKNKTDHANTNKSKKGPEISAKEMIRCKTCNQQFSRRLYNKHTEKCIPYDDSKEFNTALENLQIVEEVTDLELGSLQDIDEQVINNFEEMDVADDVVGPIGDCKSVLGSCIVTGNSDTSASCLCAQITSPGNTEEKSYSSLTLIDIKLPIDDLECIDKRRRDENACEGCECASICSINNKPNEPQEIPILENRNDGIIKIKETFDINIEDLNGDMTESVENKELNDFGSPINTCKDVLGKCIVSGNGTIGEGCLCAKMTADNQQMNAQEIEDITPCPKNTWLSQRL